MRLLLDTHIWVWSVSEPERISRRVLHTLRAAESELWLSPISAWEVLMLHSKRRIRLHGDVDVWLSDAMLNIREAPLTHEIVVAAYHLQWPHGDPADRFLAATAQVLGLTLVTADERLLALNEISTLANR